MKYLKRLKAKLPRRSLCWLSAKKVIQVNARFVGLYLEPGQWIVVAPPKEVFNVSSVKVYPAQMPVCFEFKEGDLDIRCWLSLSKERLPRFNIQVNECEQDNVEWNMDFRDPRVKPVVELLKHYSRHFPFARTENFLINNGHFVA